MTAPKVDDFRKHFKKDDVLLKEGEEGNEFFLLEEGSVDVFIHGRKVSTLDARNGQEFFGEVAAMLGGQRTATVIAATNCRTLCIAKLKVEAIISSSPSLGMKLVRSLCRKLSSSAHTYAEVQIQNTSLLNSGNTEVTLKNYMKGLLHLMDKAEADPTGETMKSLGKYFRGTNPWSIQQGDENMILDLAMPTIVAPAKPSETPVETPAEGEAPGGQTMVMSVQPPRPEKP